MQKLYYYYFLFLSHRTFHELGPQKLHKSHSSKQAVAWEWEELENPKSAELLFPIFTVRVQGWVK